MSGMFVGASFRHGCSAVPLVVVTGPCDGVHVGESSVTRGGVTMGEGRLLAQRNTLKGRGDGRIQREGVQNRDEAGEIFSPSSS